MMSKWQAVRMIASGDLHNITYVEMPDGSVIGYGTWMGDRRWWTEKFAGGKNNDSI